MLLMSPIAILWKVEIEIKKKIRLFLIWGCGLLAVLCSLMRMLDANFTSDIFWSYTQLLTWTSLDVTVGCMVISLPILDAMIAANLRKVMAKTRKTNTGGRSGYGDLDKSNTGLGPPCTAESTNTIGPGYQVDQKPGDVEKTSIELNIMQTVKYAVRYSSVEKAEAGGISKQERKRGTAANDLISRGR